MTTYSTIADVRNFGVVDADVPDVRITTALAIAKQRIDRYCGHSFAAPASKTIDVFDVASATVSLPTYTAISAVAINTIALDASMWTTITGGIRLLTRQWFDADGFIIVPTSPMIGSPLRERSTLRVTVTGTFGDAVDETIGLCSTILASQFGLLDADDALPPPSVELQQTPEGRVTQKRSPGFSTGNLEVDGLLDDYLFGGDLVS